MGAIPLMDVAGWTGGDESSRDRIAGEIDGAMPSAGFLAVVGHDISPKVLAEARSAAGEFFGLPREVKQRYAPVVGGRGWLPMGIEANGYRGGTPTPPDFKESFVCGPPVPPLLADGLTDACPANLWPEELPGLEPAMTAFLAAAEGLALLLLEVCARARSLAINTGDRLSLWTGGQWRSTRHRVLPPSEQVPDEQLLSLVFFHSDDADALIEPFGPASGGMRPVIAGDHLRRQREAITMPAPPI